MRSYPTELLNVQLTAHGIYQHVLVLCLVRIGIACCGGMYHRVRAAPLLMLASSFCTWLVTVRLLCMWVCAVQLQLKGRSHVASQAHTQSRAALATHLLSTPRT
jgi:hypothetical protein